MKGYEKGNFVGPTILTNVQTDNPSYTEEIFGPVLLCLTVSTMEDGLAIVNANKYGNSGVLFTGSGAAARKFQRDVDCGQVSTWVIVWLFSYSYSMVLTLFLLFFFFHLGGHQCPDSGRVAHIFIFWVERKLSG